jgi:hypothetical protein
MTRIVLFALGLAFVHAAFSAQSIGRLFYTPGERAQLDAVRTQKPTPQAAAAAQEPPRPTSQTITYSGIVRRSDGRSTLWLNNKAVDEKDALSSLAVTGRVRPNGEVTLQVPETGASINLKVGQRAEMQTGHVVESRREKQEAAAKKEDAAKGEVPKGGTDTKADGPRPKGPEPEPAERKAEAAPAAPQRELSPVEAQQRAAARARGETK